MLIGVRECLNTSIYLSIIYILLKIFKISQKAVLGRTVDICTGHRAIIINKYSSCVCFSSLSLFSLRTDRVPRGTRESTAACVYAVLNSILVLLGHLGDFGIR